MTTPIELRPNVIRPDAKFTLHQTNSGTFRILQDGEVHPLLVGFETEEQAYQKLGSLLSRPMPATSMASTFPIVTATPSEVRFECPCLHCRTDDRYQ